MRQSRFSEEQIIAILREHEAGAKTADVCRRHGVSDATFYKWKAKCNPTSNTLSLKRPDNSVAPE